MQTQQIRPSTGKRYSLDCGKYPGSKCSLKISGSEEEVLNEGMMHATRFHGEKDEPGLRDKLRQSMSEEKPYKG